MTIDGLVNAASGIFIYIDQDGGYTLTIWVQFDGSGSGKLHKHARKISTVLIFHQLGHLSQELPGNLELGS